MVKWYKDLIFHLVSHRRKEPHAWAAICLTKTTQHLADSLDHFQAGDPRYFSACASSDKCILSTTFRGEFSKTNSNGILYISLFWLLDLCCPCNYKYFLQKYINIRCFNPNYSWLIIWKCVTVAIYYENLKSWTRWTFYKIARNNKLIQYPGFVDESEMKVSISIVSASMASFSYWFSVQLIS